eukprot:TRINITY_DN114055_c0_g1_i1.p2 TRINITY_DN114055_c0_g1~~TRINITY_DN114055_c0_g1_i1.p2  ORF type:complete len:182 (+),score=45.24 TRINITY_DN114055_c0_g1_i1:77-622(+)
MVRTSLALLAAACAAPVQASWPPAYPTSYCSPVKFDVTGIPLKLRVTVKSAEKMDIQANLEGFTLQCLDQSYKVENENEINVQSEDGAKLNCVEQQFQNMAADMSDLKIKYEAGKDGLGLISNVLPKTVVLGQSTECPKEKFGVSLEDDDDDGFGDDGGFGDDAFGGRRLVKSADSASVMV